MKVGTPAYEAYKVKLRERYNSDPEYRKSIIQSVKKTQSKYPEKQKAQALAYRRAHSEEAAAYGKRYYQVNRSILLEKMKVYERANPEVRQKIRSLYRSRLRKATPRWLTDDQKEQIWQFYKNRPVGYHVDHIVPIQGENVSGLHVPWNLQYLPASENIKKSNKVL